MGAGRRNPGSLVQRVQMLVGGRGALEVKVWWLALRALWAGQRLQPLWQSILGCRQWEAALVPPL